MILIILLICEHGESSIIHCHKLTLATLLRQPPAYPLCGFFSGLLNTMYILTCTLTQGLVQ